MYKCQRHKDQVGRRNSSFLKLRQDLHSEGQTAQGSLDPLKKMEEFNYTPKENVLCFHGPLIYEAQVRRSGYRRGYQINRTFLTQVIGML